MRRVGGRPGRGAGYEGAGERRDKRPFLFRAAGCLVPPLCTITPHLRQAFQSRMRVGRGGGRVLFVKGGERACKATSRGAGAGMGGVNKRPVFFRAQRCGHARTISLSPPPLQTHAHLVAGAATCVRFAGRGTRLGSCLGGVVEWSGEAGGRGAGEEAHAHALKTAPSLLLTELGPLLAVHLLDVVALAGQCRLEAFHHTHEQREARRREGVAITGRLLSLFLLAGGRGRARERVCVRVGVTPTQTTTPTRVGRGMR